MYEGKKKKVQSRMKRDIQERGQEGAVLYVHEKWPLSKPKGGTEIFVSVNACDKF